MKTLVSTKTPENNRATNGAKVENRVFRKIEGDAKTQTGNHRVLRIRPMFLKTQVPANTQEPRARNRATIGHRGFREIAGESQTHANTRYV